MLMEFFIGMRIANAVSDPERVSLLKKLFEGETAAETLLETYSGTREGLVGQLNVLIDARLVESRIGGLSVRYRLADESRGILKNLLGDNVRSESKPAQAPACKRPRTAAPAAV